jgi:RNA polymerase sigma-70 factor (ECF subfamily)
MRSSATASAGASSSASDRYSVDSVEVPDDVLMARIVDGDNEALACLFHRYARLVRAVGYKILRDSSEADDLVQDVFLFVHQKSALFDRFKSSARSWIVQMAYHRAIDRRRYLGSRHFYTSLNLDDSSGMSELQTGFPNNNVAMESLVGSANIVTMFGILSEDQRHTLNLYFFEGYTFGEIAVQLKQSLRNVRNHYYRGLDKLRKQIHPGKLQGGSGCGKK